MIECRVHFVLQPLAGRIMLSPRHPLIYLAVAAVQMHSDDPAFATFHVFTIASLNLVAGWASIEGHIPHLQEMPPARCTVERSDRLSTSDRDYGPTACVLLDISTVHVGSLSQIIDLGKPLNPHFSHFAED